MTKRYLNPRVGTGRGTAWWTGPVAAAGGAAGRTWRHSPSAPASRMGSSHLQCCGPGCLSQIPNFSIPDPEPHQRILVFLIQKIVTKLSEIWSGSWFFTHPGVKKAPYPGSGTLFIYISIVDPDWDYKLGPDPQWTIADPQQWFAARELLSWSYWRPPVWNRVADPDPHYSEILEL